MKSSSSLIPRERRLSQARSVHLLAHTAGCGCAREGGSEWCQKLSDERKGVNATPYDRINVVFIEMPPGRGIHILWSF